jgi:DNA-binding MarR family transcriptional regulator/GNAT superfamily N-acetyltransferase
MGPAAPAPLDDAVSAFRRFNRAYTRVIGLLDESLVQSGFSLTEARVLFELAMRAKSSAGEIAAELSLDSGYLSRILRKFAESGVLARGTSRADARQAVLRLTRKGKAAFADLDRRSAAQAREMLERLTPLRSADLIRSMHAIEGILAEDSQSRAPFILRPHRSGDIGWVIARHGALYAQEYGWDARFEALVAGIAADFLACFDPARERCWIAERDADPLGTIMLVRDRERDDTCKLRLLLVEPSARGLGLGRALVRECVAFARACGYRRMTLWTQSILEGAHHLYREAGFRLVAEVPHRAWGVELVGQTWDLDL